MKVAMKAKGKGKRPPRPKPVSWLRLPLDAATDAALQKAMATTGQTAPRIGLRALRLWLAANAPTPESDDSIEDGRSYDWQARQWIESQPDPQGQ